MVWLIVVVAILVLGLAAWAGAGKLGELPPPVTDRPKGRIPRGPLDEAALAELVLPVASFGYQREQVDEHLASAVLGKWFEEPIFDVVAGGYDMQVVDEILEQDVFQKPFLAEPETATVRVLKEDPLPDSPHHAE